MRQSVTTIAVVGLFGLCASAAAEKSGEENRAIIRLPLSKVSPAVDGKLSGGEYDDAVVLAGAFPGWGFSPRPQSPTVYLKRDAERLYVAYDNPLGPGERPTMRGAVGDNAGICMGNAIELFFLPTRPAGELLEYIQFAGNARGCVYDAKSIPQVGVTYVAEYNVPWLFRNAIVPGHWLAEISAKFGEIQVRSTADGEHFDADFGRDGGTGPNGVHSYTLAYHQIQSGKGVRIVFDAAAPAVQWRSFGDFEHNTFDPKLRLKSTGGAGTYRVSFHLTADKPKADGSYETIFRKELDVALPADGAKDATVSFKLEPKSKGIAHYRVTDGGGKVVFHRTLNYTANLEAPRLYTTAKPKPMVVTARMAPSYGRIGVTADIIDFPGDKSKLAVEAAAYRQGRPAPLGKTRMDRFALDYAEGILDVGKLTAGTYVVKFRALDRATSKPLGFDDEVRLVRKVYEWEGNSLGVSDRPPPPWPAMTVTGQAVRCWGREHRFTGLALPASIATLQPEPSRGPKVRDVLAGPVRLVAERGGKPLTWEQGPGRIVRRSDTAVEIAGTARAPSLRAEVRGTLEYDGFYKVRLKVTPKAGSQLDSLRVEVPVPTAAARLFYSVGESMRTNKTFADLAGRGDGVLWDSKTAARNALIKGNFLPVAWLGDEDRGVSWMCDNDRTWVTTFDRPCLDVVRRGGETVFRMHLVNRPAKLTRPIEVTFGLQATPVRPRPKGGSWKKRPWFGWGYFDKPLIYDGCFKGIAKPGDPAPEAWYRTPEFRKQNRWWRYFCFNSDRIAEGDKLYGQMIRDFGAEWYSESVWVKLQNRAHQDFELWAYKKWHDIASLDGLYYDNAFPAPSTNLLSGAAWIDAEGRLRPGYVVMAYRDFMKRVRTFWTRLGPSPVMKTHMTDTPISGYLGFCDFWLDGENGGYPDPRMDNPDFVDRWYNKVGMANLRITLGRQWGAMPMYLYSWGIEPTHAVLGLFDLANGYKAMGLKPYHDFGLTEEDVEFIPHWDARKLVKVAAGGPDVLTAAWKRPGQVRVLVSNLSGQRREVLLSLSPGGLHLSSLIAAVDEKDGCAIPVAVPAAAAPATVAVGHLWVNRHDYRVVIVAAPGRYTPLDPALGKALEPPRDRRIEGLCDEFATVRSVSARKASPHIGLKWGRVFESVAGRLRIRTSSYKHALLARPFGRDSGSVQVKIRESTQGYGAAYRPSLCLYWGKDRFARIVAFSGQKVYCETVNGPKRTRKEGPECGLLTWVKITLSPKAVEFHCSTDGKAWRLVASHPRAGLDGPATHLLLGHGNAGPNPFLRNDSHLEGYFIDSFFDDLIVAR